MLRFVWSQLARRRGRALSLAAGVLVAATGFTLLTSAVATARLETTGTVERNARSAYDLLVRPAGASTELERRRGLVRDNHLSGIFGGITLDQYRRIRSLPGVEVAAPVANLGYLQVTGHLRLDLRPYLTDARAQLFRVRPTFVVGRGLRRYADAPQYLYVTRGGLEDTGYGPGMAEDAGGRRYDVCLFFNLDPDGTARLRPDDPNPTWAPVTSPSPFDPRIRTRLHCQSVAPGSGSGGVLDLRVAFPVLFSAIDPEQEDRLVGLSRAVVSGRMLRSADPVRRWRGPVAERVRIPVINSSRTFHGGTVGTEIERLDAALAELLRRLDGPGARRYVTGLRGRRVARTSHDLAALYPVRTGSEEDDDGSHSLWATGPVRYRPGPGGVLRIETEEAQDPRVYTAQAFDGADPGLPIENSGVQTRRLTPNAWRNTDDEPGGIQIALPASVGSYDPYRLRGFSALTRLPLETYSPPQVTGADAASRAALGGRPLTPDRNLGGYLAQPPGLLTTLRGADAFLEGRVDTPVNRAMRRAPVSAIRIRVAGAHGIDPASRARINAVALAVRTAYPDLSLDVTAGSSPTPQLVELPAGVAAERPVRVAEEWALKGVGLRILTAVDRKSAVLFGLILVVCALFLGQSALASVRARRSEIGVLRTLGWSRREVFGVVLGELLLIGAAAGAAGSVLAYGLGRLLGLGVSPGRALVVLPVAVLLALAAGAVPAWRAMRIGPLDAVEPPVAPAGRAGAVRSVRGLALLNLRRVRGRTALGATGLAIGVAACTVLAAITLAFRGTVAGSVLGDAVVAQVRTADVVGVALALLLGAVGAADVLVLSQRERSAELAALRATGWSRGELVRLGLYEAAGVGLLGGVTGAVCGAAAVAALGGGPPDGRLPHLAGAAAAAVVVAVGLVLVTSLAPLRRLAEIAPARVLAEE